MLLFKDKKTLILKKNVCHIDIFECISYSSPMIVESLVNLFIKHLRCLKIL
jgi:hypothetical protein